MNTPLRSAYLLFDSPAIYQICVQGRMPSDWLDRIDGMRVAVIHESATQTVTMLAGELEDQAALAGVLKTLYELHLPVLSVQRLEAPCGSTGPAPK